MSKRQSNKKGAVTVIVNENVNNKQKAPATAKSPAKRAAKNAMRAVMNVPRNLEEVQIEQVVSSVAAPGEFDAVRMGSEYGSYSTAVAKLFQRQNAYFTNLNAAGAGSDFYAFLFRDPYRSFITEVSFRDYDYRTTVKAFSLSGTPTQVSWPGMFNQGGDKVHGDVLYPGQVDDSTRQYYWFFPQGNAKAELINSSSFTIGVIVYRYYRGVINQDRVVSCPPNTSTLLHDGSDGYYAYDMSTTAGSVTASLQLRYSANIGSGGSLASIPGHFALPYMVENTASADAIKLYGASLMFTNTAAPLVRQGKLAGCQIPRGREWIDFLSYSTVSTLQNACSMDAVNGMYGFLKPTQPEDFNFRDRDEITSGVVTQAYFKLSPDSDFLAIAGSVSTVEGRDGYFTASYALEYRTNDQWRETSAPHISPNVVSTAMMLVGRLPQWHENPLHLSDIGKWLSSTMNSIYEGVKEALPKIVDVASKVVTIGGHLIPLLM